MISLETILNTVDHLIFTQTGKHPSSLQILIIREVWEGATYEEIAQQSHWSEAHIRAVGANLWNILSDLLHQPITKNNFRVTLEDYYQHLPPISSLKSSAQNPSNVVQSFLEFPDGPVKLTSKVYCDRPPIESRCYDALIQPGALIRIRAPRQMGKTSLLNRIVNYGEQLGYIAVTINLELIDREILENLDRFLQWFCARVTQKLELPSQLTDYWDDVFGSKTSCKDYFENYLLPSCQHPLMLALDNVDTLFNYPATADGFLGLLRACYEEAKNSEIWQSLRLILVHSTDAYIPLNINQSPFNVGIPIELPEFNAQQVKDLAERHQLHWTLTEVEQMMDLLGGHPYLVRLALYHLVQTSLSLEEALDTALNLNSPFYPHLHHLLTLLEQQPHLVTILTPLLKEEKPIQLKPLYLFQLSRMGLIKVSKGEIQIRCKLYHQWLHHYF